MYTVATLNLTGATGLTFLARFASVLVWVALAAWTLTSGAGLRALLRSARAGFRGPSRVS